MDARRASTRSRTIHAAYFIRSTLWSSATHLLTPLYALMTCDNIPSSLFYDPHAIFPWFLYYLMPYATFPLLNLMPLFPYALCPMPYAFMPCIQEQDTMTFKFTL